MVVNGIFGQGMFRNRLLKGAETVISKTIKHKKSNGKFSLQVVRQQIFICRKFS